MKWEPHVTVATVIEKNGKYLLIEEQSSQGLVFNQPAGHLEANESLQEAAIRETLEETGWHIEIEGVVGMALYRSPSNGVTYHRSTFFAKAITETANAVLDDGIERALWMTYDDMLQNANRMRSPLVIRAVEQYQDGHRYPIECIYE